VGGISVGVVLVVGGSVAQVVHQTDDVALEVGDVVIPGGSVDQQGEGGAVGVVHEVQGGIAEGLSAQQSFGIIVPQLGGGFNFCFIPETKTAAEFQNSAAVHEVFSSYQNEKSLWEVEHLLCCNVCDFCSVHSGASCSVINHRFLHSW